MQSLSGSPALRPSGDAGVPGAVLNVRRHGIDAGDELPAVRRRAVADVVAVGVHDELRILVGVIVVVSVLCMCSLLTSA